jgi:hypothetical protein
MVTDPSRYVGDKTSIRPGGANGGGSTPASPWFRPKRELTMEKIAKIVQLVTFPDGGRARVYWQDGVLLGKVEIRESDRDKRDGDYSPEDLDDE